MSAPLAVVSGGTRGLGLAFTRRLATLGHRVIALYRTDTAAAAQAVIHGEKPPDSGGLLGVDHGRGAGRGGGAGDPRVINAEKPPDSGGLFGVDHARGAGRDDAAGDPRVIHGEKPPESGGFSPWITAVRVDVGDGDAVEAAARGILGEYGAPRVLVNNAGRNVDRPFLEMSHADWRAVLDTNLSGAFYLTRAFAPAMLAAGGGAIVNVGATTGIRPRRNGANYCASKAGLLQLTKCLALELAPTVRVNCLIPGNTETPELVERFGLGDPATREAFLADVPQRRVGAPEEIADALEFLVGPGAAYLTGQKLIVDGGQFMW